ncbi:hypothetical protein IWW34DRAFT_756170 [Fusarium oxysporum f. sp. albedinis]|nr:hypothetical protein IWW34DRAFT_756170 [Fusarium oxysporum f. sp. albedinis]
MAPSTNPDISAALFSTSSTANSDPDTATSFNRSDDNTEANVDISSTAHVGYEGIDWHRLLGYLSSNLNKEEGSGSTHMYDAASVLASPTTAVSTLITNGN